jgi:hypothetical protein
MSAADFGGNIVGSRRYSATTWRTVRVARQENGAKPGIAVKSAGFLRLPRRISPWLVHRAIAFYGKKGLGSLQTGSKSQSGVSGRFIWIDW